MNKKNDNSHQKSLDALYLKINKLPASEIKYYLFLLFDSLKHEDPKDSGIILEKSFHFCDKANTFLNTSDVKKTKQLNELHDSLLSLIESASLNSLSHKVNKSVITGIGLILGLLLSTVLGVTAAIGGLFTRPNFLKGALDGFVIGVGMGMALGTQIPKKWFSNDAKQTLSNAVNALKEAIEGFSKVKTPQFKDQFLEEVSKLKKQFSKKNKAFSPHEMEIAFNEFLTTPNNTIEICSSPTYLFGKNKKGVIGHHSCIHFSLFGKQQVLELSAPQTDFDKKTSQKDVRKINGQTLIEMIVLNKQLTKTHLSRPFNDVVRLYPSGESELAYLNKLLIATNQAPTNLERVDEQPDNTYAAHLIGKAFQYLSAVGQNDLSITHQAYNNAYIQINDFDPAHNEHHCPQRPLLISSSGGGGHISAIKGLIDSLREKNPTVIFEEHSPVAPILKKSIVEKQLDIAIFQFHEAIYSPAIKSFVDQLTPYPILPTKEELKKEINHLKKANPKKSTRKYIDMLLDVCDIGYESAAIHNSLIKNNDTRSLTKLINLKSAAEKINHQKIHDFYLSLLKKAAIAHKPYTELVSTQVIGFAPLCDVIIAYNEWLTLKSAYQGYPKLVLHQYMTDLPTNGAIHYFEGLNQLTSKQRRQVKLYACQLSPKFLFDNLTLSHQFAGLYDIPTQKNPMIRKGFKNLSTSLHDKWDQTVWVHYTDYEIQKNASTMQNELHEKKEARKIKIKANEKVASIMLGSQASTDSLKYVPTFINIGCDKVFIFGGLNSNLYGPLQAMIKKEPSLKNKIICLGNQDDTKIQPIITRSTIVDIQGGGLSTMEQMAMEHNKDQLILIHHADTESLALHSAMAWEKGNVDKLIETLGEKNIRVLKTSPNRCYEQLSKQQKRHISKPAQKSNLAASDPTFFSKGKISEPQVTSKTPHFGMQK